MSQPPISPIDAARRDCDMALALIMVPFLLPLSWWLLARRYREPVPTAHNERQGYLDWRRRLTALVALDSLLVAGLALIQVLGLTVPGEAHPPRIGVLLDPGADAAKVLRVMDGSPAAAADIRAGDIITAVDGAPIDGSDALREAIGGGLPDVSRSLTIERSGEHLTLSITPTFERVTHAPARGFFEPDGEGGYCGDAIRAARGPALLSLSVGIGALLLLWLYTTARGGLAGSGWGAAVLALIAAPLAGGLGSYYACRQLGGMSLGVALLGLLAQGLALLLAGGAVWWWLRRQLSLVLGPQLSLSQTLGRGSLYMIATVVRVGLGATVLLTLFPGLQSGGDGGMGELFSGGGSPLGKAMVLLAAVVLAPLAEETIFRGLILPGLARRMAPMTALWLTAILFAIFHVPSHGGGAIVPGLLGLVFGWARLRSGSLRAPILLHAANNLFVTLLAWLAGSAAG